MSNEHEAEIARLKEEIARLQAESRMWRGEVRIRGLRRASAILQEAKEVRWAMSQAKTKKQWDHAYSKMECFLQLCENSIGEFQNTHER